MIKQSKSIYTSPEINVQRFVAKDVFMVASGNGILITDRSWDDFFTGGTEQ